MISEEATALATEITANYFEATRFWGWSTVLLKDEFRESGKLETRTPEDVFKLIETKYEFTGLQSEILDIVQSKLLLQDKPQLGEHGIPTNSHYFTGKRDVFIEKLAESFDQALTPKQLAELPITPVDKNHDGKASLAEAIASLKDVQLAETNNPTQPTISDLTTNTANIEASK